MEEEKNNKIEKSRGASDDFEAIKILLDSIPSLKKRVLHKLRELQKKDKERRVTSQELRESQRSQLQKEKLKL